MRLTPASEQLLKQQLTRGGFQSPEEVIQRALEALSEKASLTETGSESAAAHVLARILNRKGVTLGGIRINNLIHQGHRV